MSDAKLTKGQRVQTAVNVACVLLHLAAAVLSVAAGWYIVAAIWVAGAVAWTWITRTWIRTHRLNNETAAMRRQWREFYR